MSNSEPLGPFELMALIRWLLRQFVHAWACTIYPFTRQGFGRNFFRFVEGCSIFVVLGFVMLSNPRTQIECNAFLFHFCGLLFLIPYHRFRALIAKNTQEIHTLYDGAMSKKKCEKYSESELKRFSEPVLVVSIGVCLMALIGPTYGLFVAIGGLMGSLDHWLWIFEGQRQSRRINDAEIDQFVQMEIYDELYQRNRRRRR